MLQQIYLSRKQSRQVNKMFNEFQSYLPFKENTFYTFTDETLGYVKALIQYKDEWTRDRCTAIFRDTLKAFIAKYYVNGFKLNNKITYNCKLSLTAE